MNAFAKLLREHAKAIVLAFVLISISGFYALKNLPSDVYPELSFPRIAIIASAGDTSAERILLTTTKILEEAAAQVYRVRWVRSKTIRGSAELSVDFQTGTDMIFALHQLQGRLAEVQPKLPLGVSLTVELVTPAIFPILSYNATTNGLTQADLYSICKYQIQPELSRVDGVSRIQIQGGDLLQIAVEVDASKLTSYGMSLSQIADAIGRSNKVQVVGHVDQAHQQNLIIARGEATDLSQVEDLVVATKAQKEPIYLKDLAKVSYGFADRTNLVSIGKHRGLVINVFRQPSANVLNVSDGVRKAISQMQNHLPLGVDLKPAYDESMLVSSAVKNVEEAIYVGIGMIVLILLLFLRSWRATLIAVLTIPVSALATFGVMYLFGQSLNLMSLGGLAVAIGLVIDDAIVVIENVHRQLRLESDSLKAVSLALSELVGPVTSSTLTTVVVFLPLGLLSGVAGQFFKSLTVTLSASVLFSWLVAMTLTPLLSIHFLRANLKSRTPLDPHFPSSSQAAAGGFIASFYSNILRFTLKRPVLIILAALLIAFAGTRLYGKLASDFLPRVDEGSYVVDYLAPPGASLSDVDAMALKMEEIIAQTPEVKTYTRRTGAELGLFATQTNKGDILVVLQPADKRKRKIDEIMDWQRQKISDDIPELEVDFHQILQDQLNDLSGTPKPIEVRIFGEDPAKLRQYSDLIQKQIATVAGIADLSSTAKEGAPEIDISVDPVTSGKLGLSPTDVITQVQDSLLGRLASQIKQGDRLVDIRVRLKDNDRLSPEFIGKVPIVSSTGAFLPLASLAKISRQSGESSITCENQQRYVSVEGELGERDLGSVIADIKQSLSKISLSPGYSYELSGLYATQKESFAELTSVLILASVLVYMLMVVQFRSFLQPLAIFVAVPLALFGAEVALLITNTPFNVSSFMGLILLVGLVVKNGIILLEYTNRLRREGMNIDDALIKAGSVRLRPIVMTTICTLLGLLPLACGLGAGSELQKPLAIAVIGGLLVSTALTLLFVPALFRALEKIAGAFSSR